MCAQGANSAAAQGAGQLYAWSAFEGDYVPPVEEPPADEDGEDDGEGGEITS